jgi:hypothetical protein
VTQYLGLRWTFSAEEEGERGGVGEESARATYEEEDTCRWIHIRKRIHEWGKKRESESERALIRGGERNFP